MDKWNSCYKNLETKEEYNFYGEVITYKLGYAFLRDCEKIEDWGCGAGGFKRFFEAVDLHKYVGIDGSITPFSNIKADLVEYTSETEGLFMRHIIEHNYEWDKVLNNALRSFTKKMCFILFTPFSETTEEIAHNRSIGVDVPDLSFSKSDLIQMFEQYNIKYRLETLRTGTQYGVEHVFYLEK